jgi:uncharacterized membrane protein
MLSSLDVMIVAFYATALFALAQWVSREKPRHSKDAADYLSRKTTATGALLAPVGSAILFLALKLLVLTLPFIEGVWLVFVLCLVIAVFWSLEKPHPQFSHIEPSGVSL